MNILFVCTGNTCRSPIAEGIMKKKIEERKLDITVSSAGTGAFAGDTATENAVKAALFFGADISSHRSRQVNGYILDEADFIVCMTQSHKYALLPYVPEEKLITMGEISDPYGMDEDVYLECAKQIESELEDMLNGSVFSLITPMTQDNVPFVAEIEKQCFSKPWSEDGLREELRNSGARFFVYEINGKVAGYMGMHIVLDECYIANIAVLPGYRRQGIGEKLLVYGETLAIKENCAFISLEVRISNRTAISLYEKRGFEKMGERKNFYSDPTENALIMTKNFNKE